MLIDWFTVGAQILNFLILVWLMKRFLYRPILDAIDAREARIAAQIEAANAQMAEAQKERAEFQQKNQEFDEQRAARVNEAANEVRAERERLLEEARRDADALAAKHRAALMRDAKTLRQTITARTQEEVFAITRQALRDLADARLEEQIGDAFVRRLRELDEDTRATLAHAIRTGPEPAVVRSAFDLPDGQRAAIQNALNTTFPPEVPVRFETAPSLLGGVELVANGQKIAWSIAGYLSSLEKSVEELTKARSAPSGA